MIFASGTPDGVSQGKIAVGERTVFLGPLDGGDVVAVTCPEEDEIGQEKAGLFWRSMIRYPGGDGPEPSGGPCGQGFSGLRRVGWNR